jgi:hypothetical protein
MQQIEYVKIANDGNSKQIMVNRPFDFDGDKFKTKTKMGLNDDEYYIIEQHPTSNLIAWVTAKQKMTLYVRCEEHEAEIIVLPYYAGHSFEKVIKVVDSNKLLYVIDKKLPLTRIQQTVEQAANNEPLKYEPKDNNILGFIAMEWVDNDNTLIQIYNGGVTFIKEYTPEKV